MCATNKRLVKVRLSFSSHLWTLLQVQRKAGNEFGACCTFDGHDKTTNINISISESGNFKNRASHII